MASWVRSKEPRNGRRRPTDGAPWLAATVNPEAASAPRKVTEDPYGEGWLLSIRPVDSDAIDSLLTAEEYALFVGEDRTP